MKRFFLLILLVSICSTVGLAKSGRSHASSSSSKPVKVREYTRKDGTRVRAHTRSQPGTASTSSPTTTATSSVLAPRHAYKRDHVAGGYTLHPSVERDRHGRIKRSEAAKNAFKRQHPCPSTGKTSGSCPGYVIDHVNALECGGADQPGNMQWQTVAEGKAKDKTERFCR